VTFLLDQNLSPRLVELLHASFPDVVHVRDLGLASATDETVWDYARAHGLTIVSKDSDFHQRSFVRGHPPKGVWIRRGNCSTSVVAGALLDRIQQIGEFAEDPTAAFLIVE
jgi:predicted nuclease of predicted toxin-antitoxin system